MAPCSSHSPLDLVCRAHRVRAPVCALCGAQGCDGASALGGGALGGLSGREDGARNPALPHQRSVAHPKRPQRCVRHSVTPPGRRRVANWADALGRQERVQRIASPPMPIGWGAAQRACVCLWPARKGPELVRHTSPRPRSRRPGPDQGSSASLHTPVCRSAQSIAGIARRGHAVRMPHRRAAVVTIEGQWPLFSETRRPLTSRKWWPRLQLGSVR